MYVVGITIGLLVAWPYAKWKGFTENELEKVVGWAVPAGLVGARLYYVIQQPLGPFLSQPWRVFAVWEGGMAFYGAIFCGRHCDTGSRMENENFDIKIPGCWCDFRCFGSVLRADREHY